MSPEKKPPKTDDTSELIKQTQAEFVPLLNEMGIPAGLVEVFETIVLPGTEIEQAESGHCFFRDVGLLENHVPDGRYKAIISNEIINDRAERLEGFVPPGHERQLATKWIAAHELLGHGLEAAFRYATKTVAKEGLLKGLPTYKSPVVEYVEKFAEFRPAPNLLDAQKIESERWAEGFAQEILTRELVKSGMSKPHIISALDEIYGPIRNKAQILMPLLEQTSEEIPLSKIYDGRLDKPGEEPQDPNLVRLIFGYASPMPIDEIARRYNLIIRQ